MSVLSNQKERVASLGTSICLRCGPKKQNKTKQNKTMELKLLRLCEITKGEENVD